MSKEVMLVAPSCSDKPALLGRSRPNADFVAHLIATAEQVPQLRKLRRADSGVAVTAYAALGQWPTRLGRLLARSL